MKVTFLIPPVLDGTRNVDRCFGCNYNIYFLPLLPVLYCATIIKKNVERILILDFAAQKKTKSDFTDFIKNDDSDVYVFYTVFLSQNTDIAARRLIRGLRKKVFFVYCGPQATFSPEVFLDAGDTFAIRGEPEFIFKKLIGALQEDILTPAVRGISFLSAGKIIHNPMQELITDIDSLPIPDRNLLDHSCYYNPKLHTQPHTAMLTSRGCFGQCWFCVPNSLSYAQELEYKKYCGRKPPARCHSAGRVIEEFIEIARGGFKSVSIIDDQFLWDEQRTIDICNGIKNLKLEWSCLSRPEKITDRAAAAMKEAGCSYVDLGTESFDEDILKAIKKNVPPGATNNAAEILKKHKIKIEINILFGATVEETEGTIRKTIEEVKKINADYVLFSIANPFPGTEFYEAAKKHNWLYYGEYVPVDPAKDAIISYPHLSKKKLESLIAYAYFSYYFNPRYLFKQLVQLKNPTDLRNKLATAYNFFKKNFLRK
jgi:anaerobic magnesium-protoporphyrin IX monomethyl ester cyclase